MQDQETFDLSYFYDLAYENKTCVDCKGAMPRFVSINNGLIICHSCAQTHLQLGYNVSYIREISDDWDPYLWCYIERGGNNRFIRFMTEYHWTDWTIEQKYKTKACEYYRKLLRSEVFAEEPPEKIFKDDALLSHDEDTITFPEFKEYKIYVGEKPVPRPGIINTISEKLSDKELHNALYNRGKSVFHFITKTGGLIYNASKPVVKFVGEQAYNGVNIAYHYLTNDDITPKDKETRSSRKTISTSWISSYHSGSGNDDDVNGRTKGNAEYQRHQKNLNEDDKFKYPSFDELGSDGNPYGNVAVVQSLKPNVVTNETCQVDETALGGNILNGNIWNQTSSFEPTLEFNNTNMITARKKANNYWLNFNKKDGK